jgi:hypothetical protein
MTLFRRTTLACIALSCSAVLAQDNLGIASYDADGKLAYPADLYAWIQTAASVGSDYNDNPIDVENPGTIGVVQMEPVAWKYFMENNRYADGTMFLLSFYRPERKSDPQLQGFVQGDLVQREIHVIDKQKYPDTDGHAFFVYRGDSRDAAAPMIDRDNVCVACHIPEGGFDGTFAQFYPDIRAKLGLTAE